MEHPLLAIRNLTVNVNDNGQQKNLLDGLDLNIPPLEIVALVGGSGSGKTTTGLSILRILPSALKIKTGQILFNGENLLDYPEEDMRRVRGKDIAMIFQEPLNAFNPVFTIGDQIEEVLEAHANFSKSSRREKVHDLLKVVEIPDPLRIVRQYPHELSGGMRQRAMIAMAIAAQPKLIIADEPTSNLDVTLQARIIELFRKLRSELKISMLLITHDLGMVNYLADEMIVLSAGKVVEAGQTREVLKNPHHPLTRQFMDALL